MRLIILGSLFLTQATLAATGGHHEPIPTEVPRVVIFQALNLGILLLILGYIVVPKLRAHFEARRNEYFKTVREMEALKLQAEKQSQDLRSRLEKLQATANDSLQSSRRDAAELQTKLVEDAKEQGAKMRAEALKTVNAEVYRAVQSLRTEVIADSIGQAREKIKTQIKDVDQKRLQKEFVEKIRVVES